MLAQSASIVFAFVLGIGLGWFGVAPASTTYVRLSEVAAQSAGSYASPGVTHRENAQIPPCDANCQTLLNLQILPNRKQAYWNIYYDMVIKYIHTHFPGSNTSRKLKIVEVGTAFGGMANHLLTFLPASHITAVDPLVPYDSGDSTSVLYSQIMQNHSMSEVVYSEAWGRALEHHAIASHGSRYTLHRTGSLRASTQYADAHFDMAFIDGLHTRYGIFSDMAAWWNKVHRNRGLIMFNDYDHPYFPIVKKETDNWMAIFNVSVFLGGYELPPGRDNAVVVLDSNTNPLLAGI